MGPKLDNKFCCVINKESYILAALVSSYIFSGKYNSFFEFLEVSSEEDFTEINSFDEHQISRSRSRIFNIRVNNSIKRLSECENIILVGLSDEQKTYLNFDENLNIIEIEDEQDVENYLLGFAAEKEILKCSTENIFDSLYYAHQNNLRLELDDFTTKIVKSPEQDRSNGLIVIEKHNTASTVIAINYASTIKATIRIINPPRIEENEVNYYIEKWKLHNSVESIDELRRIIFSGIDAIDLDFSFVTFFTIGIPYSLIFENIVPISHVHLHLDPDFFVFNNIYFENNEKIFSSIVFSPKKFSNEETQNVIKKLEDSHYLVFDLLDENATTTNIDLAVQTLPFSLLHFCSHGGKMKGARIDKQFIDKNGNQHSVEYDRLLSVMPDRSKPLIKVILKYIPRKFDNLIWRSKELKALNYPHHVFVDMMNSITSDEENFISKRTVENIPNSCAIECKNFHYQAMFDTFCDNHSPVVFNNTCWSNSDIKANFIANGSKSYIGTLWNINNSSARDAANIFYDNIFRKNLLENFFEMQNSVWENSDKNVYILWGLPFSNLSRGINKENTKIQVISRLQKAVLGWLKNYKITTNPDTKRSIQDFINFLNKYIFNIVIRR